MDEFFKCAVCHDDFDEPKILPCIHRYCQRCLQRIIDSKEGGTIKCPLCKEECTTPVNGAVGFPTDFFIKSMQEHTRMSETREERATLENNQFKVFQSLSEALKKLTAVAEIKSIRANGWFPWDMANIGKGTVAVIGRASGESSSILVVNTRGEVLRQEEFGEEIDTRRKGVSRCATLSPHEILTSSETGKIGIYDVRNGSHTKKHIADVTGDPRWAPDQILNCAMTSDSRTRNIFVGTRGAGGGVVLVLDDQLNYQYELQLPEKIRGSLDIAMRNGRLLLVGGNDDKGAYVVDIEGRSTTLSHELTRPEHSGGNWFPTSICTDKEGSIFILWGTFSTGREKALVARYSWEGPDIISAREVAGEAQCITVVATEERGEELVVLTHESGKMFMYELESQGE